MTRNSWTSEDWAYTGDVLMALAQSLPPVLGATAQLTYSVSKVTADHEARMRELKEHELRLQQIARESRQTVDVKASAVVIRKRRRRTVM